MPGRRPGRRLSSRATAKPLIVIAAVVVILVAAAGGYVLFGPKFASRDAKGPTIPFTGQIDVLPSQGTSGGCVSGTPGAAVPTKDLSNGTLQANTFNVPPGTVGAVGLCYNPHDGSVFNYVNWSQVGGTGGWFSFPQIAYGVDAWGGSATTFTGQSSHWSLPAPVATVVASNVWGTVGYTYHPPSSNLTHGNDFAFDDFLTQTLPPQFEQGPFVEVMVWFDHHNIFPLAFSPWSMPTLVGTTLSTQPWDVGYWCHAPRNGSSPLLTFDFSFRGQSSSGMASGTMGVNLSLVLAEVNQLMPAVTCWTGPTNGFSQFYLDQANLGSEDTVNGSVALNYNWTENAYCFHLLTRAASVATVTCSPPGSTSMLERGETPVPAAGSLLLSTTGLMAAGRAPSPAQDPHRTGVRHRPLLGSVSVRWSRWGDPTGGGDPSRIPPAGS